MGNLDGKAVIVTGAGRGLGEAYARHAAEAGARVVVNDLEGAERVAASIADAGGEAVAHTGSVTDPAVATALVELCGSAFGRVDGLVNNAGITHFGDPWDDEPDVLRSVIEVNVLGTMYCGTAAAKVMRGGSIVNVVSGAMLGRADAAAYSASKGAVASMTYSWAGDLAGHGVRVNAISPIAWTRLMAADPNGNPAAPPPERVAPLVTYLLSDLSAGITGQVLRLADGHLHAVRQPAIIRPVLHRETWTVEEIAAAVGGELVLESPPRDRWTL